MSAVLTAPPAQKLTPGDLLRLPDQGKGFELVDGELKELNGSFLASYVGGQILADLSGFVHDRNLGWVSGLGASYRCFPDDPGKIRRANVSFHTLDRLTTAEVLAEDHLVTVPDLVAVVVAPRDRAYDLNARLCDWLAAGAKLVWIIHPIHQTIHIYRADGTVLLVNRGDTLTAEPVLPEFRVPVADLFRLPASAPTP